MRQPLRPLFGVAAPIVCAAFATVAVAHAFFQDQAVAPEPTAVIEVVALGRDGGFTEDLRAADFAVTVEGERRAVVSVRRVSRGPGASADAAARQAAAGPQGALFGAEAHRSVLVLVDQSSIPRGEERPVVQAATAFLDRLGLTDRVAVLPLPLASEAALSFTTERPEARLALSQVTGSLVTIPAEEDVPAQPTALPDQDRLSGASGDTLPRVDPTQPAGAQSWTEAASERDLRLAEAKLRTLRAVLATLRAVAGRKVVALFSAGLPAGAAAKIDDVAIDAIAARVTIFTFGVRPSSIDARSAVDTAPLERLAAATGGAFGAIGKNPERIADRAVRELGACYVLTVESPAGTSARRRLRVETARKGIALRTAAWFVPLADAGDWTPPISPAAAKPEATGTEPASPDAGAARTADGKGEGGARAAAARAAAEHDAELKLALARLFEYAEGYERQYSMLVAEEDYRQDAPMGGVHLRSDLLLVRPLPNAEWMSFRDVFEVDGRPVQDRNERLQRLFLDPSPEALARLDAIRDESARYNIGAVERTINVPLLPVTFLRRSNRARFEYELAGRAEAAGIEAWRIRYVERERPTMVRNGRLADLPVSGTFLVDTLTGAIVESKMEAREGEARAEIVVRYRRDPALGLWVPSEMKETYVLGPSGQWSRWTNAKDVVRGRATYSNFRRFQVKTEEKVTPPK